MNKHHRINPSYNTMEKLLKVVRYGLYMRLVFTFMRGERYVSP